MAIPISKVIAGGEYETQTKQHRKVTSVVTDSKKRKRVHYLSKSGKIPGAKYTPGHTKSNPPLLSSFARACSRRIK